MRRVDRTVEGSNSRDDLDRLVVRDIVRLSLCEKTSPLNSLSGDGSTSSANTASFSPFREQILTFFRLQALAFIVRDLRSFRFLLPSLFDHGLQVYASTMLKPDYWQAYLSGSKIFGEFGDPWDLTVGLTYFPFGHKEVRINGQALYTDRSAVGYAAIPYVVGGTGWTYTIDVGTWF